MRFHHFAIEVKDMETSIAFYQKFIGLREAGRLTFNDEKIVFLANHDFRLELLAGGQPPNAQSVHICFEVDRISEVINTFQENSIYAIEGPFKLKNGWETVFYQGPDGEVIEFLQT